MQQQMKARCPRKHQAAQQQIEQPDLPASKPQMTFCPARMDTLNHKPSFRYSFDLWSDQLTLWYRCEFLLLFYRRKELWAGNPAGWPAGSKLFLSLLRHTRWGSIKSAEEHVGARGTVPGDQSTNRSPRSKRSFNLTQHKYICDLWSETYFILLLTLALSSASHFHTALELLTNLVPSNSRTPPIHTMCFTFNTEKKNNHSDLDS